MAHIQCKRHGGSKALLLRCLLACSFLVIMTTMNLPTVASSSEEQQQQQQAEQYGGGPIDLSEVKVLTLRKGAITTGRRSSGVPQLKCVSGCDFEPDTVQCHNMGSDGTRVQWKCEADLPASLSFGLTTVTCEGYDSPSDTRVLAGSCGLEYSLNRRDASGEVEVEGHHEKASVMSRVVAWLILAFFIYCVVKMCKATTSAHATFGYGAPYPGAVAYGQPIPMPPPGMVPHNPFGPTVGYGVSPGAVFAPVGPTATAASIGFMAGQQAAATAAYPFNHAHMHPHVHMGTSDACTGAGGSGSGEETRHASAYASTTMR